MKYSCLPVLLLLAFASRAVSQTVSPLPGRDDIVRITIDHNPLRLYTKDSLAESLPCFTPVKGGRTETPKLADRGSIELKSGEVINWFAPDSRSLLIVTRAGSQLLELSGDCAYRRAGPAMKLHQYVFSMSDFPEPIPRGIDRGVVERFLREILSRDYPEGAPAGKVRQLALLYDTQGIVPDLLKLLDGKQTGGMKLQVSIILAEVVGMLGDTEQRELGRRFYRQFLALPYRSGDPVHDEFRLRVLIDCFAAYTPEESDEGLLRRIDQALARLRPLATKDWDAGREMRQIEDMRGLVYRAQGASAMKREILEMSDQAKRLDALVDIYLDVDQRYSEFVSDWAVNKIVRAGSTGPVAEVIAAFRRALTRLPREARAARRSRALHAVEFFGGKLTPAERAQTQPAQRRFDLLSVEGN